MSTYKLEPLQAGKKTRSFPISVRAYERMRDQIEALTRIEQLARRMVRISEGTPIDRHQVSQQLKAALRAYDGWEDDTVVDEAIAAMQTIVEDLEERSANPRVQGESNH